MTTTTMRHPDAPATDKQWKFLHVLSRKAGFDKTVDAIRDVLNHYEKDYLTRRRAAVVIDALQDGLTAEDDAPPALAAPEATPLLPAPEPKRETPQVAPLPGMAPLGMASEPAPEAEASGLSRFPWFKQPPTTVEPPVHDLDFFEERQRLGHSDCDHADALDVFATPDGNGHTEEWVGCTNCGAVWCLLETATV